MHSLPRFGVILPAAGTGSRTGADIPKQFVEIAGATVLHHTLSAFSSLPNCAEIILAMDPEWMDRGREAGADVPSLKIVPGGKERQDSIRNAMAALAPDTEYVLVHDAARPLVTRALVERVLAAAQEHGAGIPGMPVVETVKLVDTDAENRVLRTIPREGLFTVQTPQGFRSELLRRAYAHAAEAGFLGTDDASLVEELGETVVMVAGEPENLKITWPEDFPKAEQILRSRGGAL